MVNKETTKKPPVIEHYSLTQEQPEMINESNLIGNQLNIMMIDDSSRDMDLLEELLKIECDIDMRISKWTVCSEALHHLEFDLQTYDSPLPDVIILDVVMPEMNGKLVLKKLKSLAKVKDIPIAIYSSGSNHKNLLEFEGIKANAFFLKPLNVKEFIKFLKENSLI